MDCKREKKCPNEWQLDQPESTYVKCFHCVNLDFAIQISFVSITDEVKPHVHKQTLYMKETHFLAIEIKVSWATRK